MLTFKTIPICAGIPARSPRRCLRRRFRRGPRSSLSWRYVPQKLEFESDDTWPKLQRFFGKWVLFLVSDIYPKIVHVNCPCFKQTVHTRLIWMIISSRWSTTTTWCPLGTPLTSASTRQTWTRSCWRWFSCILNDGLHCALPPRVSVVMLVGIYLFLTSLGQSRRAGQILFQGVWLSCQLVILPWVPIGCAGPSTPHWVLLTENYHLTPCCIHVRC